MYPPLDHQMVSADGKRHVFDADDRLWAAAIKAVPKGRLPDIFLHCVRTGQNLRCDYLLTYFEDAIKQKYELAFLAAVRRDNVELMMKFLAKGVSVDAQVGKPLISAVENKAHRALALLLEKGADVRVLRHRAMMNAAEQGDVTALKIFAAAGCDLKLYDNELLRRAVKAGQVAAASYVLAAPIYADPNDFKGDALKIALLTKNKLMIELLFAFGARVDAASFAVLETMMERENVPKAMREMVATKHKAEEAEKRSREKAYAAGLLQEIFGDGDFTLADLRRVLPAHGGISGFQLAVMAGKIDDVIEKMKREKSHFILADFMFEGQTSKRSAADILAADGTLGRVFTPVLWGYKAEVFGSFLEYLNRRGYVAPCLNGEMMANFQRGVMIDHTPKKAFQFKKK
jgi:hypothetical protein